MKANLDIDLFPDLPVGIVVCASAQTGTGSMLNFDITYCNPFACSLLAIPCEPGETLLLTDIPFLKTLLKPVRDVLKTGVSYRNESYEQVMGYWIDSSIYRNETGCTIYLQNNTPNKRYKDNLQRRLELESIIAGISNQFSNIASHELDTCVVDSLAQIGRFNMADRAYIFSYSADEMSMSCTHEWCAEGIEATQARFQNRLTHGFPWWHQKLVDEETILVRSLADLPDEAASERKSLAAQGIQSLLVVPMIFDKKLVGFVGFDVVRQQRNWDKNDIDLLNTFAGLVITVTSRVNRELELQRVNKRLEGVNRISNVLLNSHLSDEQADHVALKHIYNMIPCEVGAVFRVDQKGQLAYTQNPMRRGKRETWTDIQFSADFLYNRKFTQGQEILINQLQADTYGLPTGLNPYQWGHRSFLAVPLFAHQHYIGLLVLLDKAPDFFTQEHVLIAHEVAGQLSILLFQEDVNQRLASQAAKLNENNQLLQAVITNVSVGLGLLQPVRQNSQIVDFTYLLANPENEHITGYKHSEMAGEPLTSLFPHVVTNGFFDRIVHVLETGETAHFQQLVNFPSGDYWIDYSLVRVGDTILLTAKDITHLKQIEDQLRQTNADLEKRVADRTTQIQELSAMQRAILKHAGLGISATDTEGIIQLVNPALEAMSGYSAEELVGKVTPSFIGQPDVFQPKPDLLHADTAFDLSASKAKSGFIQQEYTIRTKQETYIPVLTTISGLYNEDEKLIGYVNLVTDIAYLKRIEEELKQANQRIQLATIAGKLGVWEWGLETNELVVDEHFYTLFGIPDTIKIQRIAELAKLVHPADLTFFNQNVKQIIRDQQPFEAEFRIIFPTDKSIHFMKADGLVLQNEAGKSSRMIGVVSDQTAKKQADSALKESEQRYRSLVDHLNDIVFYIDYTGAWVYLNPVWQSITGFSVDESIGKPALDFVYPDDRERNRHLCELLMSRQKAYCQHIVRYVHKGGGYRWISVFAQVTVDEHNEVTGMTGTLTDVTERKKAEEAVLESEQRFRDIAENVDEIFWIRDLDEPRFIYMNSAYERFSGQPVQKLYENPYLFLHFILEEDRPKVMNAFMHRDPDLGFSFRARHQDGSIRYLDVRIFTVKDEAGLLKRRIGMATDSTSSVEKELILEESLQKERSLNYLKSQFISTASHEFRTPLATISSSVELLKYYVNAIPEGTKTESINQHIDKIYREVFSLNDLISDTLTISKIEEGQVKVNREYIDLKALSKEIIETTFCDRQDKRSIKFNVTGRSRAVLTDKKLISHVLKNILANAFKFSTKNPRLTLTFDEKAATFYIIDDGIGIPKEDIPNLYGKFFRARNAGTIQGTGLGLAICLEYVTLLKGCITIDSKEGVGTTVRVILPIMV